MVGTVLGLTVAKYLLDASLRNNVDILRKTSGITPADAQMGHVPPIARQCRRWLQRRTALLSHCTTHLKLRCVHLGAKTLGCVRHCCMKTSLHSTMCLVMPKSAWNSTAGVVGDTHVHAHYSCLHAMRCHADVHGISCMLACRCTGTSGCLMRSDRTLD